MFLANHLLYREDFILKPSISEGFFYFPLRQNLILSSIPELLSNPQQTFYYLTYFKLRIAVRHTYGGFTITDELCHFTGLRKRTLREHVRKCIQQGWVRMDAINADRYTIVSHYTFANPGERKHVLAISVDDAFILSTNWKNISRFRALLQEAENQRFIRFRVYQQRKAALPTITQRDHVPVQAKPKRKQDNGSSKGQPVIEFSCGLASGLTGISTSTASRYHSKLNDLVTYKRNRSYCGPAYSGCEEELARLNDKASQAEKLNEHGWYYTSRGIIYFSGISTRTSHLRIKRIGVKAR